MARYLCPTRIVDAARRQGALPVAVAAAESAVAIESARRAHAQGLIEPVLVGDPALVHRLAADADWDLEDVRVVPAADEADAARRAVALARGGEVGAIMKGHLHTDTLMLAALDKAAGLRAGRRFTHAFHLTVPHWKRELILTDAAVNIAPDVATKLDIIRNAVDLAHTLGTAEPRVAILSCTEEVTERVQSSLDAAELTRLARDAVPGAVVYGPLAFDLAVSTEAARIKGIDNPVAGRADILVVPSIEAGNALFKMMVHFLRATAAGIVLGARVPILLTSRADPPEARIASAAIARLVVGEGWRKPGARPDPTKDRKDRPEGLHA